MALRNLDDIGAAVAVRHLHHAEPVAMRVQPHGLGIDRHRIGVAGQIGQIAAMQADGHGVRNLVESVWTKLASKSSTTEARGCSTVVHSDAFSPESAEILLYSSADHQNRRCRDES